MRVITSLNHQLVCIVNFNKILEYCCGEITNIIIFSFVGKYYLVDSGYLIKKRFLTSFKGGDILFS